MKKAIAILLAVAIVLCITVTALADDTITSIDGKATKDVVVKISGASEIETVYSVNVAWDSLDFTYTFASGSSWDPATHDFKPGTGSSWDKTTANIVITNHSNTALKANALFGTESAKTTHDVTATLSSNTNIALATAVGTTVADAPKATAGLTISGTPDIKDQYTLGTITVSLAAA